MTEYQIFMRDNLTDDGSVPSQAAPAANSPDIIPRKSLMANPEELIQDPDWGKYMDQALDEGRPNFIYVRGKSFDNVGSQTPVQGNVTLYVAEPSLFLQPENWQEVPTTGGTVTFQATGNDQRLLGSEPFMWTPPNFSHHCMIARVSTNRAPNPLPTSFPSLGAFYQWVVNDPAVAWKNLRIVSSGNDNVVQQLHFANIDTTEIKGLFTIVSTDYPVGTVVRVQSQSECLEDPIDRAFEVVEVAGQIQQISGAVYCKVKGNSSGVLVVTTIPGDTPIPTGATLETTYHVAQEHSSGVLSQDAESEALLRPHARPLSDFGTFTDVDDLSVPAVPLGQYNIEYQ